MPSFRPLDGGVSLSENRMKGIISTVNHTSGIAAPKRQERTGA